MDASTLEEAIDFAKKRVIFHAEPTYIFNFNDPRDEWYDPDEKRKGYFVVIRSEIHFGNFSFNLKHAVKVFKPKRGAQPTLKPYGRKIKKK